VLLPPEPPVCGDDVCEEDEDCPEDCWDVEQDCLVNSCDVSSCGDSAGCAEALACANVCTDVECAIACVEGASNGWSPLISGAVGAAEVSYMVPTDDSLGESWTALDFDDSAWSVGAQGLGYEMSGSGYAELISTEVVPTYVEDDANTVMIRAHFDVFDPTILTNLLLRLKVDDGYVAYLNGVEVARQGVEGTISWTSESVETPDSQALVYNDYELDDFIELLVAGDNVLAVHLVNYYTGSSDLLFISELSVPGLDQVVTCGVEAGCFGP